MEIGRSRLGRTHGDRVGLEVEVERVRHRRRRPSTRQIEMRHLPQRMHAGIGAAGGHRLHLLARKLFDRPLERQVRAYDPWPGAWFEIEGARIKVIKAEIVAGKPGAPPGTVLDDRLTIACGTAALRLLDVQAAGRAAMDAGAFLRGRPIAPGTRLS